MAGEEQGTATQAQSAGGQRRSAGAPPRPPTGEQSLTEEPNEGSKRSRPYNFWFAVIALGIGFLAFALTLWIFGEKLDTAALGSLFTLIGTVAGAYFGIKNSSDTADTAARERKEANERIERANRSAKAAWGGLTTDAARELREQGLL